ncbi:MAG: nucleotidyltransferase family protein, partial [Deltaproteobacteria bacterium]|nr:nucleotidyltransferase family protein [Deltaproteobacteria bacterium]
MSNTFLKLVQPIPLKGSLQIDEKELAEIESIAKRHNLFMLLYVQLQKFNKEISQNSDIQNYLKERKPLFLSNAIHSVRQEVIEKEIFNRLSAEQVPAIVMKGNEIAKEIYNDPNCRMSVDIDILIKMSDALKADTILTKAGYSRTDE